MTQVRTSKTDCPSPHGLRNKAGRVCWGIVWMLFFRPSPRMLYGWRRFLLRLWGAKIGKNARIFPSVRIWAPWNFAVGTETSIAGQVDCYCIDKITIGDFATVSQYSILLTGSHDISDPAMKLTTSAIEIKDSTWVCASVIVLPGVTIHQGAVAGAGSVVTKNVAPWSIVAGNPATNRGTRKLEQPSSESLSKTR